MEQADFRVMSYLLLKNFRRRIWIMLYQQGNGEDSDFGREHELKPLKSLLFNSMNVDGRELK